MGLTKETLILRFETERKRETTHDRKRELAQKKSLLSSEAFFCLSLSLCLSPLVLLLPSEDDFVDGSTVSRVVL